MSLHRLCVNEAVARPHRSATRINEVCLDLQRQAADDPKHRGGCQFLQSKALKRVTGILKEVRCRGYISIGGVRWLTV